MLLVDAHCRVIDDMVAHAFRIQAFELRRLLRLQRERKVMGGSHGRRTGEGASAACPVSGHAGFSGSGTGSGRTLGKRGR